MEIILATTNSDKVKEYEKWFGKLDFSCKLLLPDEKLKVEENGDSLWENARLKVEAYWKRFQKPVLADDTGLFVEALGGKPGVNSARYSEEGTYEKNREKLLKELIGVTDRKAYFMSVIAFKNSSENIYFFMGKCNGEITLEDKRDGTSFGYDPVFRPAGYNRVFSEMSLEEKNAISHRGKAIEKLVEFLRNLKREG